MTNSCLSSYLFCLNFLFFKEHECVILMLSNLLGVGLEVFAESRAIPQPLHCMFETYPHSIYYLLFCYPRLIYHLLF